MGTDRRAALCLAFAFSLASACAADVQFEQAGGDGAGGDADAVAGSTAASTAVAASTAASTVATSSSSGRTAFEAYCADMEADEVANDCIDEFDPQACLASVGCVEEILRPDAAPVLLDCIASKGCQGVSDECVRFELAGLPLTPAGQAFFDACIEGGTCDSLFCYQPYWLTDAALASSAQCLGSAACGATSACAEDTALGACSGWLRQANPWWL